MKGGDGGTGMDTAMGNSQMGMNLLNSAMLAAAQAMLTQQGQWGPLGLAGQTGGSTEVTGNPAARNTGFDNNTTPTSNQGNSFLGGWGPPQDQTSHQTQGQYGGWGTPHQGQRGGWN